eukprot:CAMPEP_0201534834 /NCGR_PEP_ID=MMETSP0161_2-20130828/57251_1 /ASSEMBLY_ACC=CAM_ASM_000251 /TAXON_ID=180227 /ORGANISM="Neoparamoeba aestuarina, Strain SoJaBio B1-5/56/2" /LENGTH=77 /DNA_ID=CAMNT_0047939663 /DNA_START=111 /DNA_END=344 /DNA_ORIENTATION=+
MCLCHQTDEQIYCVEYFTPNQWKVTATAVYFWDKWRADDEAERDSLGEKSPTLVVVTDEVKRYVQEKVHLAQPPRKV